MTGRQPLPAAPAAPSTLNPQAPREMDAIVLKALSKAAEGRYESAATLAAGLRAVSARLDVRSGDREPPAFAPHRPARRLAAPWLIALLIVAIVAALVWLAARPN